MPHYMKAITSVDHANREYHAVVLFNDDDPNSVVCQYTFGKAPTGHGYDPDKRYVSDEDINAAFESMGFHIVGRDAPALSWGERIVIRANSPRTFFDPITREWYSSDPHNRNRP